MIGFIFNFVSHVVLQTLNTYHFYLVLQTLFFFSGMQEYVYVVTWRGYHLDIYLAN